MSDPSVTERRIRPIQDAVASGNWKQALQLCDKWAKKGERTDRFLALKAFVLVNQPDKSQHDRGQQEVLDLCKRSPPITDHDAIYQIQDALKNLSLREEEGPKLWERAVAAKQGDKDLCMRWLNQAIFDSNWRSAQKATMGLRNAFPKERNYEFWNILMCYLIHMQDELPEKDRMLFGTLAYRMISKAAEIIPRDQEQLLAPGKAISTPEEIALLAQVLNSTGHVQETVQLLQGETLNEGSRTGKQDPQLVLSLLLESLDASEQWDEALKMCEALLAKPEYQSDDRIWNLWLKAQSESPNIGSEQKSRELLDTICSTRPIIRAAQLAKMKLLQKNKDEASQTALLETCKEYYKEFSLKAFCFDDLRTSLQRLDTSHLENFTKMHSETQGNLAALFGLKLSYNSLPPNASSGDLLALVHKALELYQTSISDPPACPEAAYLAVLALLRYSATENTAQTLLFATIFLRVARSKFEDHYALTVLLIQLQSYLGITSQAIETFTKLSVKNMQWETVGHLVLTRISSLHPAPSSSGDEAFDPVKAIDTGLTILENADNALVRGIREGLRFNGYSNIYNSVKMRSDIERSMNRQIYAIEERKLQRILGVSEETVLEPAPSSLVDKRDFSYMPRYRDEDSSLLAQFRCGPLPKEHWINAMAMFDNTATLLKAELATQSAAAAKAFEQLKPLTGVVDVSSGALKAELTEAELSNLECHKILADAVLLLKEDSAPPEKVNELLDALKSSLSSTLAARKAHPPGWTVVGARVPGWQDLHCSLAQLETLQVVANFVAVAAAAAKKKPTKSSGNKSSSKTAPVPLSQEALTEIKGLALDLETQIHSDARDLKSQITQPGVLGKLVDLGMAREGELTVLESLMERICDEVTLEMTCGSFRESWDDALDGLLGVKIKFAR